jgi:hypothetical protein
MDDRWWIMLEQRGVGALGLLGGWDVGELYATNCCFHRGASRVGGRLRGEMARVAMRMEMRNYRDVISGYCMRRWG